MPAGSVKIKAVAACHSNKDLLFAIGTDNDLWKWAAAFEQWDKQNLGVPLLNIACDGNGRVYAVTADQRLITSAPSTVLAPQTDTTELVKASAKTYTDALSVAKVQMDACAALVKIITSGAAPAGFRDSVVSDLSNNILAEEYRNAHPSIIADGKPDEINSKLLKPIPTDHLAYLVSLKTQTANMQAGCRDPAAYKPTGDALVKQATVDVKAAKFDAPGDTAANNKSRADAVAKGLTDYLVSSTALADAMTKLSTDRMHQAYTGTWVKQFLERN